eukprot:452487_1
MMDLFPPYNSKIALLFVLFVSMARVDASSEPDMSAKHISDTAGKKYDATSIEGAYDNDESESTFYAKAFCIEISGFDKGIESYADEGDRKNTKSCKVCNTPTTSLCSACRSAYYCGPKCQRGDWKTHKVSCKKYQKVRRILSLAGKKKGIKADKWDKIFDDTFHLGGYNQIHMVIQGIASDSRSNFKKLGNLRKSGKSEQYQKLISTYINVH